MSSVCTEPQAKFHSSFHHLLRDQNSDMSSDSPRFCLSVDTLLQKFLPFNAGEDDGDPYSSDHFRMYEFKVRRCTRSRSHDWTDCPFAHPGEKARRRDPCRFQYSGAVCPEFRRGSCSRGDSCEFAHGVFECWLHPLRYRTEACKDGKNCKRKVCFFAHSPRELRILPAPASDFPGASSPELPTKKTPLPSGPNHCCLFCRCGTASSPTSTLAGMSHFSPPLSPEKPPENGFFKGAMSYKDALTELMSSLESMNMDAGVSPVSGRRPAKPWIDVSSLQAEDQLQFIISPSTPRISRSRTFPGETGDGEWASGAGGPDLRWVNELLM